MRYTAQQLADLYEAPLEVLREKAFEARVQTSGRNIYFNRNFHVEPSNICTHRCRFCSYRRDNAQQEGAWSHSLEQIESYCREKFTSGMTEVHIVGSVHPDRKIDYYEEILRIARRVAGPSVTLKAYTAVEIDDMCRFNGLTPEQCLMRLKDAGLQAMPGGGAEIFDSQVRTRICPDKCDASRWLEIHRTAHRLGIPSNATMLFGHLETREQRIDHLLRIRQLQDETGGFGAFIPLRYSSKNNSLSQLGEMTEEEVMRTFAVIRLALDNVPHIKAYWPMLGKNLSIRLMEYGADDFDGTVNDSTKIYSMAGSSEQKPVLTVEELRSLAENAGFKAVERDSFYKIIS